MLLIAVGIVLVTALLATRVWIRSRIRRGTGAPRCGRCKHALLRGQFTCPECGHVWNERAPGAAAVFPTAAGALERCRRTALVHMWVLGILGVAALSLGALYATERLPPRPLANATWIGRVGDETSGYKLRVDGFTPNLEEFNRTRRLEVVTYAVVTRMESSVALHIERHGSDWEFGSMQRNSGRMTFMYRALGSLTTDQMCQYYLTPALGMMVQTKSDPRQPEIAKVIWETISTGTPSPQTQLGAVETQYADERDVRRQLSAQQQVVISLSALAVLAVVLGIAWVRAFALNRAQQVWAWAPRQGEAPIGAPNTGAP